MRFYKRRVRAPRASKGGRVLALPKQPTAARWDDETGTFIELSRGPYLGRPASAQADDDGLVVGADDFGADGNFSDMFSDGGEPANEYVLRLDAGGTVDQWLQQQFQKTCAVQMLQMAEVEDSSELVLMTPVYNAESRTLGADARVDTEQQAARANPFALLHVRAVLCSDGIVFCNTCANPGCNRPPAANDTISAAMQHHNQRHLSATDVFGDTEPLCRCAKAAISALWPENDDQPEPFPYWFEQQEAGVIKEALAQCRCK